MWDAVRGVFSFLGRFIAALARLIAVPLGALWRLFLQLGTLWKAVVAIAVIGLGGLYVYFIWQTQAWTNFNPDYPAKYSYQDAATPGEEIKAEAPLPLASEPAPADADNPAPAGQPVQAAQIPSSVRKCSPSAIADVAADLTDFNVNQNAWISSMLLYKLGFFGLDWDRTPFLDNKASFQRGINAAVRRTAIELVDNIGRLRGTSQIDGDLQKARGNLQFAEDAWYFGLNPFGPKTPTPSYYRSAIKDLRAFNGRLENCQATFDARADNLIQFVTASRAILALHPRSSRTGRKTTMRAGSIPGRMIVSGSPMASFTPITACCVPPIRISAMCWLKSIWTVCGMRWKSSFGMRSTCSHSSFPMATRMRGSRRLT